MDYNYGYKSTDMSVMMDNYRFLEEANKKGINLAEMDEKLKKYEKEIADHHLIIEDLKKRVQGSPASAELFSIHEQAVKDVPTVQHARMVSDRSKIHALHRVLMAHDSEYKDAYTNYEKAVQEAYVQHAKSAVTVPPVTTETDQQKKVP